MNVETKADHIHKELKALSRMLDAVLEIAKRRPWRPIIMLQSNRFMVWANRKFQWRFDNVGKVMLITIGWITFTWSKGGFVSYGNWEQTK